MPRRAAIVTQADIARTIRAMKDAGLPVCRVVVRPDGVAVEAILPDDRPNDRTRVAEREEVVDL